MMVNKMSHNMRKKRGFTLTEIIVSLAILGIIAVSFMSMFSFGFITMYSGNRTSVAQQYAKDTVEKEIGNPMVFMDDGTFDADMVTDLQINFQGSIVDVSGARIELDHPYLDARRLNRSVKLDTFVAQRIFLSDYSVVLNGTSDSVTVNVYANNLGDLFCRIVRPDDTNVSTIATLSDNIALNGTFTVQGGSTASTDQKTRVLIQSISDPNVYALCTVINH